MKNRTYTREEMVNNARAYNKYLTFEYLGKLSYKQLLCFVHPSLREEITGNRPFFN